VVIGLESNRGMQVILWRDDLSARHPLQLPLGAPVAQPDATPAP
jgi:hypothetical protein